MTRREKLKKYGLPGSVIAGSAYFRQYCRYCNEPMRADSDDPTLDYQCDKCSGVRKMLTPGGHAGPLDSDSGGYQANARKALEDG